MLRRFFVALGFLLLMVGGVWANPPQTAQMTVEHAKLELSDAGFVLSADFDIKLNTRLEEAANKGLTLFFVLDFDITYARWYWFDQVLARRSKVYQLSYHALTRQYRLVSGKGVQSYASLSEALENMAQLKPWLIAEKDALDPETRYVARLKMYLDLTQMPKTFQVSALGSPEWNLSSDWFRWNFTPKTLAPLVSDEPLGAIAKPVGAAGTPPSSGEAR